MNEIMIMSIQSEYARQIFNGTKKYEFRKSAIRPEHFNKPIYIYSAKVDKAFIGTVKVTGIVSGTIDEVLAKTGYDKLPGQDSLKNYFKNTPECFALELSEPVLFENKITLAKLRQIKPNIMLPQYFAKITDNDKIYSLLTNNQ